MRTCNNWEETRILETICINRDFQHADCFRFQTEYATVLATKYMPQNWSSYFWDEGCSHRMYCTALKCQSQWLCRPDVTYVSHNVNNNSWQAPLSVSPQHWALLDKWAVNQTELPKMCLELTLVQLTLISEEVSLPSLQKKTFSSLSCKGLVYFVHDLSKQAIVFWLFLMQTFCIKNLRCLMPLGIGTKHDLIC